jgi:ketosteroid isomerase-like protein
VVNVTGDVDEIVTSYFERVTAPDAEAFAALFAATAEVRDPVGAPALAGPAGMTKFHARLHRAWQSLEMTPVESYVRGREVAVRWQAHGTSVGGNEISFDGINTFVVDDDGKIARLDAFWNFEDVIARF